ncbi:hypothetical protein F4810DRAFT_711498 [Camillea tinctor]|nr:hypothetical protein F4810DRAFT_711498 [Camillea tinctor]
MGWGGSQKPAYHDGVNSKSSPQDLFAAVASHALVGGLIKLKTPSRTRNPEAYTTAAAERHAPRDHGTMGYETEARPLGVAVTTCLSIGLNVAIPARSYENIALPTIIPYRQLLGSSLHNSLAVLARTNLRRLTDTIFSSHPIADMSYSVAAGKRGAAAAAVSAALAAPFGAFPSLVQKKVVVVARHSRAIASLAE